MNRILAVALALFGIISAGFIAFKHEAHVSRTFGADDKCIQYVGRIDFTKPNLPKFWAPGVYVKTRFTGPNCDVLLNDEALWGTSHNYVEIVVDNRPAQRVQTTGKVNVIQAARNLAGGPHTITICKDTESGIGYLEFVGLRCERLLPPPPEPARKLEFIGDSITCGTGSDTSDKPCGIGQWYDQHNAYFSYGPRTARMLHARWHLSAVSGIGLVHSCCGMTETMPRVFGTMSVRDNTGPWDFRRYQPDAVTICLGQNDGEIDPIVFDAAYVKFIRQIRSDYPKAQVVCLNSPMADATLTAYMKENLTRIVAEVNASGDKNVHAFFFSNSWNRGCGGHPSLDQHQLIADELSGYLKKTLKW